MPAYYNREGYGEGSGSVRYRGRGRGGFGQAGRESGSGGGRGYGRGGSRHGGERYNKWNEGGGRHGGSGGYRESSYGQSRFRDGPGSSWSGSGFGHFKERGGSSELHRSLSHLRGRESKIAMNILNAVLASDSSGMSGGGGERWDNGPPPRKMRRMDWDGVRSPPMHRDPQRERRIDPRKMKLKGYRGISGYARGPLEYREVTQTQLREMEMARLEMPRPEKKESKDSEKKSSATEAKQVNQDVKEGEQERATAEGDSPPAEADVKQSGSGDASEEKVADDVEMKDAEAEDKTKVKQEDEVTKKISAPQSHDDTNVVIPRAALKCHMCDMTKFPHTKAYLSHLESKNHEMMAHTFHNRNAAIIDVLMFDSKLACKWKPSKKGGSARCLKCLCFMSTTIQEHCQTTEHTLVSQYSRVSCCGYKYNRAILEEHRLSLRHLKNQWDIEQETRERDEKKEQEEERIESEEAFHEKVYNFKKSNESEEPLTSDTLPPYDATKPIGLNFLYKETLYRCDMCGSHLRNPQHAEYHFRSVDHYFSLCRHLAAEEEKKELERKKLEESMKEEEAKNKEENGDENDNCEDMNNMETVDEAVEDGDGDAHAAGAAADTQASPGNKRADADAEEAVASEDAGEGLERSIDSEEQMDHDKANEEEDGGNIEEDNEWSGEHDQDDAAEGEELVLNSNADGGDDEEEVIDEEGLDYEPGVGV
nr:DBIRD complex subunit ZNF326-like isoform X2 [Procambarus clarkii]